MLRQGIRGEQKGKEKGEELSRGMQGITMGG